VLLATSLDLINSIFVKNEHFVFHAPFYVLIYSTKCAQGHSPNAFRIINFQISGFRSEVAENSVLLSHYTVSSE